MTAPTSHAERGRDPRPAATLRRALTYAPAAFCALAVLWIGSRPDVPGPDTTLPLDKAAHLAMYGVLGTLLARGWLRAGHWPGAAWPLLFGVTVGVVDELRQRGIPTRTADPVDWVMDVVGVLIGFWVVVRWWSQK